MRDVTGNADIMEQRIEYEENPIYGTGTCNIWEERVDDENLLQDFLPWGMLLVMQTLWNKEFNVNKMQFMVLTPATYEKEGWMTKIYCKITTVLKIAMTFPCIFSIPMYLFHLLLIRSLNSDRRGGGWSTNTPESVAWNGASFVGQKALQNVAYLKVSDKYWGSLVQWLTYSGFQYCLDNVIMVTALL